MQNSNADAYRTVRNAVPDADAGSVVRCCTVPHLTTVPARGRTRGSGLRSGSASHSSNRIRDFFYTFQKSEPEPDPRLIPQTGYNIFFKAKKVPHLTTVPARGRTRGSGLRSGSASHSSNRIRDFFYTFQKSEPEPEPDPRLIPQTGYNIFFKAKKKKKKHTWVRIRKKIHQNRKCGHTAVLFQIYFKFQNSNADAYRTVRYRTLLRYRREGGRADPDFGPDPRLIPDSGFLNPDSGLFYTFQKSEPEPERTYRSFSSWLFGLPNYLERKNSNNNRHES